MVYKKTPHIYFYGTFKSKKKFKNPTDQKFGTPRKMTFKSQAKTKPPFLYTPFSNLLFNVKRVLQE